MNKTVRKSTKSLNTLVTKSKQSRITQQQLSILKLMYEFRFVSTKQVASLLDIAGENKLQQAQQRLSTLLRKEYIGKNFSNLDRLTGRYASYYLLPKGMKVLKQCDAAENPKSSILHPRTIHNIYKDKTASERFIKHQLDLGDINVELERLYGKELHFIAKGRLVAYDYLIDPLPDAFVYLKDESKPKTKRKDYFLEYLEDSVPFWVYRNRIKAYVEYIEDKTWEEAMSRKMPPILLVCESATLQRRTIRFLKRYLDEVYEYITFYITNTETLKNIKHKTEAIWRVMSDEEYEEIVEIAL